MSEGRTHLLYTVVPHGDGWRIHSFFHPVHRPWYLDHVFATREEAEAILSLPPTDRRWWSKP